MTLDGADVLAGTVPNAAIVGIYSSLVTFSNPGNGFTGRFKGDASDTASSPAFAWNGDPNTGMFQPAPNTIAFAAAASERMRITSAGEVAIGTTDPDGATLRVQGASTTGELWLSPATSGGNADLFLSETVSGSFGIKLRHNGGNNLLEFIGVNSSAETAPLMSVGRGSSSGVDIANDLTVGDQVQIGNITPSIDGQLHVQADNARVAKFDRYSSDGELVAWARDDLVVGSVTVAAGVVSYNAFTGSHYAWTRDSMEHGALVSLTGQNLRQRGADSEVIYGVELTARANAPGCLGAYLGLEEPTRAWSRENPHQIMAVGNGEMWVADSASGDIQAGDYLIASEVPGCAMRDDPERFPVGHIVARAAQPVDWAAIPRGPDGVRKTRISVLFESFVRDSRGAGMAATLAAQQAEMRELKQRLSSLEKLLSGPRLANASVHHP
jgi:hypothetical protein